MTLTAPTAPAWRWPGPAAPARDPWTCEAEARDAYRAALAAADRGYAAAEGLSRRFEADLAAACARLRSAGYL